MPFRSKAQHRKFIIMEKSGDIPEGTTAQWMKETKNFKKLPERVKEAMLDLTPHFTKIAIELFDPAKNPIVPSHVTQQQAIEQVKEEKTKGMSPVEYRRDVTSRNTGILQKTKKTARLV